MSLFTDSLLLDVLGILTAIVVAIYTYFEWTFHYFQRRNIPYLEPSIPFGNAESPFKRTVSNGEHSVQLYQETTAKGWKYFGTFHMTSASLVINDLDLIKHVLTKDFAYFTDRSVYVNEKDDPLNFHLFSMAGDQWRNLRVKLTPTFTSGKLKQMFQTLVQTSLIMEKYLDSFITEGEPLDVKEAVARFTTDIVGSCAFGLDCNSFKDPNSPLRVYGRKAFMPTKFQVFKAVLATNFHSIGRLFGITIFPEEITTFFRKTVEDTVNYREKNKILRKDFLQLLIGLKTNKSGQQNGVNGNAGGDKSEEGLTMTEISAQCFLFYLAGFETSSTTMTFALFELATHPELQERARDEIKTVLAKHDDKMTYDSISELKYLKQIIDETLRLYPPVPSLMRKCVQDYKIPGEDIIIEKGTKISIPVQGIHYDERYYKNPKVFDPDRFSDENKRKRHQYAHMPFGEGPRICIGERFGVMQIKVGITSILKNYRVGLSERTQLPLKFKIASFIPTTEGKIWLTLDKL